MSESEKKCVDPKRFDNNCKEDGEAVAHQTKQKTNGEAREGHINTVKPPQQLTLHQIKADSQKPNKKLNSYLA